MSLLRYDPFTSFFDDGFDHPTPFLRNEQVASRPGAWQPTGMTFYEDGNHYFYQVDLPGVKSEDLKMKLGDTHGGNPVIHLSGGRQFQSKDGASFKSSSFERQFTIGPNSDKEKIAADLKDGVLTITIPKKEPKRTSPTYIPITSGASKASE